MNTLYCTLDAFRQSVGVDATTGDTFILDTINRASRYIDQQCGRKFYPYITTRYFDWQGSSSLFFNGYDLLTMTTLTTNNGTTPIATGYYLVKAGDYNATPYDEIILDLSTATAFTYTGTPQKSQQVAGVWGYHDNYSAAWKASGQTVLNSGGITSSGTSLTVASGAAFEVGQTLQAETEWMILTGVSVNTLTVERGANGSTAAAHAAGTAISIYRPVEDVARATLALAVWFYKQDDAPFGVGQTGATETQDVPLGIPPSVSSFINDYQTRPKWRQRWQIFK